MIVPLLAALLAAGQAASSLPPELSAIRMQIMSGQPDAALEQLAKLPSDALHVRYLTGLALYHRDDHPGAIEKLAQVVDRLVDGSPERREATQVLGLSYFAAGKLQEALPLLERTRTWARDNRELGHVLGQAYLRTGQVEAARRVIAETFDVHPASAAAHLHTAQTLIRLELAGPAAAELQRALAIDPRAPQAHVLLGQMAAHRGDLEEAVALFRKAIELDPLDAMARYRLGEALSRQHKWDESMAASQQSLWINPYFSGPYIVLARGYLDKDQPGAAEGLLRRAIEYDPNNRTAHYLLGQSLQKLGRDVEAARHFQTAERLADAARRR